MPAGWLLWLGCSASPLTFAEAPTTATASDGVVRLIVVGDTGKGNAGQAQVAHAIVETCAVRGCDLILMLGDNLYPRGMEYPDDPLADDRIAAPYTAAGVPVYLVLGNHDYAHGRDQERAGWQLAWAARTAGVELPGHAWHARVGPVQLVGLDTNAALQFGAEPQRSWLQGVLDSSDAPVRVVAGHHPWRSNGPHGNAGSYEGWSILPYASGRGVARLLQPLCNQVQLYLSGHDHTRQLLDHCGVQLVVSGAGASVTRLVDRGNEPRFASATLGFAWLALSADRGEVTFVSADGVDEGTFVLFGG
ncbi:MAG: metallophosphoesterase [Myxococcales bacterium]|nr:metallophosphoesterase [Myxococcales bacterium]